MTFQMSSFAQEAEGVAQLEENSKLCQDVLNDHIAIVDESEKLIGNLANKDAIKITQFEIGLFQKNLTNRFDHLAKVLFAYSDKNEAKGCSPSVLGEAMAIYDFTLFGSNALRDTKLRRIIHALTRSPKYHLGEIKKMYAYYTSPLTMKILEDRLKADKVALPANLILNEKIKTGHFDEISDVAVRGANGVLSGAARVWGFLSDRLKWRNGHLNGNQDVLNILKANLKPLDLIYEKREFTLSNYTIPGHWGHVAVWLGTKEELIQLGVWDKDYFEPFRRAVLEGKNIVEIRKKGMEFVSLSNFINIDEIAITRIKNAENNSEEIVRNLAGEVDASYDFSFNAQSPDELTCSEMIAYSYGNIRWPEMNTPLAVTLTPDDVAELTIYNNSPAEFVLYIKGNKGKTFVNESFAEWRQLFHHEEELNY